MSLIDRSVAYVVTIFQLTRILINDERHGASVENNEKMFLLDRRSRKGESNPHTTSPRSSSQWVAKSDALRIKGGNVFWEYFFPVVRKNMQHFAYFV